MCHLPTFVTTTVEESKTANNLNNLLTNIDILYQGDGTSQNNAIDPNDSLWGKLNFILEELKTIEDQARDNVFVELLKSKNQKHVGEWIDSFTTSGGRIAALRTIEFLMPQINPAWNQVLLPLIQCKDYTSDVRAWAIYSLRFAGLKIDDSRESTKILESLFAVLDDQEAKVRQWAAYLLGELTHNARASASLERTLTDSDKQKNLRAYSSFDRNKPQLYIKTEGALEARWAKEIDTYVQQQIIISLGWVGGYIKPQLRSIWPVINVLIAASNHAQYYVWSQVPNTVKNIALGLVDTGDTQLTDSEKLIDISKKLSLVEQLIGVQIHWLEQLHESNRRQTPEYENYRLWLTTVASLVTVSLQLSDFPIHRELGNEIANEGLHQILNLCQNQEISDAESVHTRALITLRDLVMNPAQFHKAAPVTFPTNMKERLSSIITHNYNSTFAKRRTRGMRI